MKTITTKLLALSLAFAVSGCGGGSQQNGTVEAPEAAQVATPPIEKGKTGKADGLDYTVTSVEERNQIGPSEVGLKAEPGEVFVVVSYTLKNTSAKALELMERPTLSLIDAKGQSYAADEMATGMVAVMMNDPSGMSADLNPNVSAKTKAAWKVDKAAFNRKTWTVAVAADPTLTFALK